MIRSIGVRSGVIEKTAIIESGRGHRRPVKETHGFRKFFQTTSIRNGMPPLHSEYLMGHHSGSLPVESYYRPSESDLLEGNYKMIGYVGVMDALMLNEENKLRQENQILKIDRTNLESRLDHLEELYKSLL